MHLCVLLCCFASSSPLVLYVHVCARRQHLSAQRGSVRLIAACRRKCVSFIWVREWMWGVMPVLSILIGRRLIPRGATEGVYPHSAGLTKHLGFAGDVHSYPCIKT